MLNERRRAQLGEPATHQEPWWDIHSEAIDELLDVRFAQDEKRELKCI